MVESPYDSSAELSVSQVRLAEELAKVQPVIQNTGTRELAKVGFKLTLLIPGRWNQDAFAGVCLVFGCPREFAWKVAEELGRDKERKITVRPQFVGDHREVFVAACRALGVHVEEIPPL